MEAVAPRYLSSLFPGVPIGLCVVLLSSNLLTGCTANHASPPTSSSGREDDSSSAIEESEVDSTSDPQSSGEGNDVGTDSVDTSDQKKDSGAGPSVKCNLNALSFEGIPKCRSLKELPKLPGLGAFWFSYSIPEDKFGVVYGKKAQLALDGTRVLVAGVSHPVVIDLARGTLCEYAGLDVGDYRVSSMVGTGDGKHFVASFGSKSSPEQKIQVFKYDRRNGRAASLPPVPKLEEATWGRLMAIKQPDMEENLLLSTHGENTSLDLSTDCGVTWVRAEDGNVSNFYGFDSGRKNETLWFLSGPTPDQSPFVLRKPIHQLGNGTGWKSTRLLTWNDDQISALIKNPHLDDSFYFATPNRVGQLGLDENGKVRTTEFWNAKGEQTLKQINQIWVDPRNDERLVVVGTPKNLGAAVAVSVERIQGAKVLEWQGDGPSKIDAVLKHPGESLLILSSQLEQRIDFFVHSAALDGW